MDPVEKTKSLRREDLPVDLLVPQEINPNKMSDREFNLLVDNISRVGFVDPVFVRPIGDGKYRIIGGFHRWKAAKVLDMETVPSTIIEDPDFDQDLESFQIVRMNMIRGRLDTEKFLELYNSIATKYEDDLMAEAFGFADEAQFKKLVGQMAKSLPKEMQPAFKKAAEEVKTIDGLTKLLNTMFSRYGDTLPSGYMIVDFGGKDSVWVRMQPSDMAAFKTLAEKCAERKRGVDSLFRLFTQSIAQGKLDPMLESLMLFPEVEVAAATVPMEG